MKWSHADVVAFVDELRGSGLGHRVEQVMATITALEARRSADAARAKKRRDGSPPSRKRSVTNHVTNHATSSVTGPPTPPFQEQNHSSAMNTYSGSGDGVSDLSATATAKRHVTWSNVAAAFDEGWQAHHPRVDNPRTGLSEAKLQEAAGKVNRQARLNGIDPQTMLSQVMAAFWRSDDARRCNFAPGAIAGCFTSLVAPSIRGPKHSNAPAPHDSFKDDPIESLREVRNG